MAVALRSLEKGFRSLQDVASRKGSDFAPSVSRLALNAAWDRAVGSTLHLVTRPASLVRGCLTIDVHDPSWEKAIVPLGPIILGALRRYLPETRIDALRFRVRALSGEAVHHARRSNGGALRTGPEAIDGPAFPVSDAAIPDDALRHRFSGVARRYIGMHRR